MEKRGPKTWQLAVFAAALAAITGILYYVINLYYAGGHFTFPLDDSYIFLHYARNFCAGHPFQYNIGDPMTTGATSYLYALALVPLACIFRTSESLVLATYVFNVALYGGFLFLFALLARNLFKGHYVVLSTLILATTGPVTFHAFTGMDTGFFMFALLGVLTLYNRYLDGGKAIPFAAAVALLPLARPEGAAAVLILVALVWLDRGTFRGRRGRAWVTAALAGLPIYFLVNYAVGGHFSSASLLSKNTWAAVTEPKAETLIQIVQYAFFVVKSMLAGLDGIFVRHLYNANTVYTPAAYFPPLALAFFLVGWGRAARASWSERRWNVGFAAGVIFLAGAAISILLVPYPRHYGRYLAPYFPLFVIGILGGIDGLAQLIRYGRPSISHRAMFWTGAAYFLVFGMAAWIYAWVVFGMAGRDIRFQQILTADYLRENTPATAAVVTHDVGAIGYYSQRRIIDLEGLVTRDGWLYGAEGYGAAAEFVKRTARPGDYFAGYTYIYAFDEAGMLPEPEFEAALSATAIAGGQVMAVAPLLPVVFEPIPEPATLKTMSGYKLVDELNCADILSERAHGYRYARRGANNFENRAVAAKLLDTTWEILEGERLVCGTEEFFVRARPGKPLVGVVRCQPPFMANVYANGRRVGRWSESAASDEFFDVPLYIPATSVTGDRLRLRIETAGNGFEFNRPAHYYFYAPAP